MDLSGWPIDLPAVYGDLWEKRAQFHLTERLFESPDGRWAVLLFGLGEVGMNKQVGPLALFRDKATPALVYQSGTTAFWYEGIAGEPVVFSADGRGARLVEFVQRSPRQFGTRERTLDFASGSLLPLPAQPSSSLPQRWQSFRARHKIFALLVSALVAVAAIAPLLLLTGIVLEHRRDLDLSGRGRELQGRVVEFPGSPEDAGWSRVRVETGPGSSTMFVIRERLPEGREVTLLQDSLTGEIRGKESLVRRLATWPWSLLNWMVFLSPLYLGIPGLFWWLGRPVRVGSA